MLKRRQLGMALLFVAVAVAFYGGGHSWPAARLIVAVAIFGLFGAALVSSPDGSRVADARRSRGSVRPRTPPLQPGERYDTTVKLMTFPNVPIADLWRQRLKEHGIESFYKGGSPVAGIYGSQLDAALPAELWVGEHDAERARELLRDLG